LRRRRFPLGIELTAAKKLAQTTSAIATVLRGVGLSD